MHCGQVGFSRSREKCLMLVTIRHGRSVTVSTAWTSQSNVLPIQLRPTRREKKDERQRRCTDREDKLAALRNGVCCHMHNLLLFIREMTSNLRNHFDPLSSSPFDGFRNGVPLLREPVGAIENEGDCNFLAGRLHGPCVVTAALGFSRFAEQMVVSRIALIHTVASRKNVHMVGSTRCSA